MNDVVIRSGKTLTLGDEKAEIIDKSGGVNFVNILTEVRHLNGVVYLSLGSLIAEFGNAPVVEVCARLRLDIVTAQGLRTALDNMIKEATKPVDKSQAN